MPDTAAGHGVLLRTMVCTESKVQDIYTQRYGEAHVLRRLWKTKIDLMRTIKTVRAARITMGAFVNSPLAPQAIRAQVKKSYYMQGLWPSMELS